MTKLQEWGVWLPVALYAGVIFFFSSLPSARVPILFPNADKLLHLVEYGPFGALVFRAFLKSAWTQRCKTLPWVLFVVTLYALSDEIHQWFVPGRIFSFVDMFFDMLGAGLGSVFYRWRT